MKRYLIFIFLQILSLFFASLSKADTIITKDGNDIIYRDNLYKALKTEDLLLTVVVLNSIDKTPKMSMELDYYLHESYKKTYITNNMGEIKVSLSDIIDTIDNFSLVFIPKITARNCTINIKKSIIENNIQKFKNIKEEVKNNFIKQKNIAKRQQIEKAHPKWSRKAVDAILSEKVYIGMTKEQALMSWGRPADINTTITKYGKSEQWVYGNDCYLYFEGNRLTSIQN